MIASQEPLFTLAQISRALDIGRNQGRARLAGVPADGRVQTWPNWTAQGWKFESLPLGIKRQLADNAGRRGVTVTEHLTDPPAILLPRFVSGESCLTRTIDSIVWLRGPSTPTRDECEFIWECICQEFDRVFFLTRDWSQTLDTVSQRVNSSAFRSCLEPAVFALALPEKWGRWRRRTGKGNFRLEMKRRAVV